MSEIPSLNTDDATYDAYLSCQQYISTSLLPLIKQYETKGAILTQQIKAWDEFLLHWSQGLSDDDTKYITISKQKKAAIQQKEMDHELLVQTQNKLHSKLENARKKFDHAYLLPKVVTTTTTTTSDDVTPIQPVVKPDPTANLSYSVQRWFENELKDPRTVVSAINNSHCIFDTSRLKATGKSPLKYRAQPWTRGELWELTQGLIMSKCKSPPKITICVSELRNIVMPRLPHRTQASISSKINWFNSFPKLFQSLSRLGNKPNDHDEVDDDDDDQPSIKKRKIEFLVDMLFLSQKIFV